MKRVLRRVLSVLEQNPDREFTARELSQLTGIPPSTIALNLVYSRPAWVSIVLIRCLEKRIENLLW